MNDEAHTQGTNAVADAVSRIEDVTDETPPRQPAPEEYAQARNRPHVPTQGSDEDMAQESERIECFFSQTPNWSHLGASTRRELRPLWDALAEIAAGKTVAGASFDKAAMALAKAKGAAMKIHERAA